MFNFTKLSNQIDFSNPKSMRKYNKLTVIHGYSVTGNLAVIKLSTIRVTPAWFMQLNTNVLRDMRFINMIANIRALLSENPDRAYMAYFIISMEYL